MAAMAASAPFRLRPGGGCPSRPSSIFRRLAARFPATESGQRAGKASWAAVGSEADGRKLGWTVMNVPQLYQHPCIVQRLCPGAPAHAGPMRAGPLELQPLAAGPHHYPAPTPSRAPGPRAWRRPAVGQRAERSRAGQPRWRRHRPKPWPCGTPRRPRSTRGRAAVAAAAAAARSLRTTWAAASGTAAAAARPLR